MKIIRKSFVFQLMPKSVDIHKMKKFCGCCHFVYNKLLEIQKERKKNNLKRLSYFQMNNELIELKKENPWLSEPHSQTLQQSLKDLHRGFQNFYEGRANEPEFHKKGVKESFRFPQGFKLDEDNGRIYLPKIGWVRYRKSRKVTGEPKNVTVRLKGGKWYVAIQTEEQIPDPIPKATSSVGIDMGIARLATLSDGTYYEPRNYLKQYEQALAKANRELARKQKRSQNWFKALHKLQKIYIHVANARKDYLHKITSEISNNHALVVVEDLRITNMSKSASGTVENPGHNVKAKSGLNKSILDQGWGAFFRMLEYKLDWNGGILLAVPPQNTSRTCPSCGHVSRENRKTQARFKCVSCGFEENADLVGAMNILRAGHARLACGSESEVSGAVRPTAAGTLREDLSEQLC